MAFELPTLPYSHTALAERGMCQETLELHHGKHHQAYVTALNQRFVADFERVSGGLRANMMGVSGYDGMRLIQLTLEKTKGQTKEFVAAAKGLAWESPRGQVRIDPATRDIEQDMYVRRVERRGDRLVNVEIATVPVPVR